MDRFQFFIILNGIIPTRLSALAEWVAHCFEHGWIKTDVGNVAFISFGSTVNPSSSLFTWITVLH